MLNFSANHLLLLSRLEYRSCVVFLMQDHSTRRVYRLYDFSKYKRSYYDNQGYAVIIDLLVACETLDLDSLSSNKTITLTNRGPCIYSAGKHQWYRQIAPPHEDESCRLS
jgi:hypothetical protein